jgi:hypothetical protein
MGEDPVAVDLRLADRHHQTLLLGKDERVEIVVRHQLEDAVAERFDSHETILALGLLQAVLDRVEMTPADEEPRRAILAKVDRIRGSS